MEENSTETLIIGAGMAGLSCAQMLKSISHACVVLDKARGSGGRLASKSIKNESGQELVFDLGCAGFAAQTPTFLQQIQVWQADGLTQPWRMVKGCYEYVGTPRNSMLTRRMAERLAVRFSTRIEKLTLLDGQWQAYGKADDEYVPLVRARNLVLATPAEQAAALLPEGHPFKSKVSRVATLPQWVIILVTGEVSDVLAYQQKLEQVPMLQSVVCDSQKPGRAVLQGRMIWQLQCRPEWSALHRDDEPAGIYRQVMDQIASMASDLPTVSDYYVHRWLYASGHHHALESDDCLWDAQARLGVCGDYFHHPELDAKPEWQTGVESAFLSGKALAARMMI